MATFTMLVQHEDFVEVLDEITVEADTSEDAVGKLAEELPGFIVLWVLEGCPIVSYKYK